MARFFITDTPSSPYFLGGGEGLHGAKALRLRPGEEVTLCDGAGTDYPGVVERVEKDGLWLEVGEGAANRAVELGACGLWQVESARCVARPDRKQAEKKTARLRRIALEAAKQSGRGIVPRVREPVPFGQALREAAEKGDVLFFYEKGKHSLKEALETAGDRLFLFIGPEGGFAPEEAALAESMGAKPLTLGRRILRTETAPLAALAAILYQRGEMEG